MFKSLFAFLSLSLAVITMPASANDIQEVKNKITTTFVKIGLVVEDVQPSKMENLYEVFTRQGLFYSNVDGSYLIQGKVYNIANGQVDSLTEQSLAKVRLDGMAKFEGSMIVFPAKEEQYQITVFTDITCGYCRKLHNQMDEYNDLGITVRYLAFPRNGLQGQGYQDIKSVWCNADPKTALTSALTGGSVEQKVCAKPIAEQYDFGRKIGVSGTPAIVFDDGMMIPGYKSPAQMKQILMTYSATKAG